MSNLSYCPQCKRNVGAKKVFSWTWFLLYCFFSIGILGVLYIIYYILKGSDACSVCGCEDLYKPLKDSPETATREEAIAILKAKKEELDLELITKEEYDTIKEQLSDLIKS
jgi:hypothetical protein